MSDLIDRHEAIDAVVNKCTDIYVGNLPVMVDKKEVYSVLQGLISVTPKRKTGKWVYKPNEYDDSTYECSQCEEPWTLIDGTPEENNMKFCPNCGADMRGEQDG